VLQRRCSNQEVYITNDHASGTQSPALPAEDFGRLFVYANERNAFQEVIEATLTLLRIARLVHPLIDFRQSHYR
jgi:hypothetical protein